MSAAIKFDSKSSPRVAATFAAGFDADHWDLSELPPLADDSRPWDLFEVPIGECLCPDCGDVHGDRDDPRFPADFGPEDMGYYAAFSGLPCQPPPSLDLDGREAWAFGYCEYRGSRSPSDAGPFLRNPSKFDDAFRAGLQVGLEMECPTDAPAHYGASERAAWEAGQFAASLEVSRRLMAEAEDTLATIRAGEGYSWL
jgi:hypothetical protein